MLIPGRSLIPKIISNVRCAKIQAQPCGVDLTLKQIKIWSSSGRIDFDNSLRASASTERVPFFRRHDQSQGPISRSQQVIVNDPVGLEGPMDPRHESVMLETGSYLVEFNEIVNVPLNLMGQIFVRSSLFRSGALLSAGVMDTGYQGAVGAMLQVVNPHGLILFRDARLAQIVFHEMREPVEGYSGTYQGSRSI